MYIPSMAYVLLVLYQNNSEEHCTQVYEKRLLKDPKEFQIFHNSITIMHTLKSKHSSPKLYEDNYKYYILGEKMKLQSLENLLLNGFDFQEVPFVSIIFMILQNLQKYQQRNIYHGNLNLSSVFINVENETLEIVILYPRYLEKSSFTIENDLYNLGILIYQITFYTMKNRINQYVDLDLIDRIHNLMADQNYKENQYNYQNTFIYFSYKTMAQYPFQNMIKNRTINSFTVPIFVQSELIRSHKIIVITKYHFMQSDKASMVCYYIAKYQASANSLIVKSNFLANYCGDQRFFDKFPSCQRGENSKFQQLIIFVRSRQFLLILMIDRSRRVLTYQMLDCEYYKDDSFQKEA